jgi:imidazoleglycerol phosphate dehydratase HisB
VQSKYQSRRRNEHHKIEATFKGLARAIKMAVMRDPRNINQLPVPKEFFKVRQ